METKILKQMTTTQKEIPNLILKATHTTTVCFISKFPAQYLFEDNLIILCITQWWVGGSENGNSPLTFH